MGPLAGIKVIEFAGIGPGPFCGMLLSDMGADVVRIDRPGKSMSAIPMETHCEVLNRGRRSVVLDLKSTEGVRAAKELIAKADIVIEGFRPGVMEKLGLGPEDCIALRPSLIYGRMTGWGQDGALASSAGHDVNYIALTGALDAIGAAGGPPIPPLVLVGDFGGGGMLLALGVLAAHIEAKHSGVGQVVDAAMVDGSALLMSAIYGMKAAGHWDGGRGNNVLDGGAPWYSVYEMKDGLYGSVAAIEPQFYAEFIERIGLDMSTLPPQHDKSRWPELRAIFAEKFKEKTLRQWCDLLEGTDACFSPVLSMSDAPQHPHMKQRNSFTTINGVVQPAPAPRFSKNPTSVQRPPPQKGEHTQEVLQEWGVALPAQPAVQQ